MNLNLQAIKEWAIDAGERVASSFVEAVLGAIAAGALAHGLSLSVADSLAIAGLTAAAATLKTLLAPIIPSTLTPASLVRGVKRVAHTFPVPRPAPVAIEPDPGRIALVPGPIPGGRRTGRKPFVPDASDLRFGRYLTKAFKVPSSIDWAAAVPSFGMLLNDSLGDCGEAGWLHGLQVWLCNVGKMFVPTNAQALTLYEQVAGYVPGNASTDVGTNLRDLLKRMTKTPVPGTSKILAYVSVDPKNEAEVKAALTLTGWLYAGLNLTDHSYQDEGVNWTLTSGKGGQPDPELGHCVIFTGFTSRGVKTVTWGEEGTASWGYVAKCCDELYAIVSPDWMNAAGVDPSGLNTAQLEADVATL